MVKVGITDNPSATNTSGSAHDVLVIPPVYPEEVAGEARSLADSPGNAVPPVLPEKEKDPNPSHRSWMMDRLCKLGLLMWKNLVLMRRHWVILGFEILTILFLFTILASMGGLSRYKDNLPQVNLDQDQGQDQNQTSGASVKYELMFEEQLIEHVSLVDPSSPSQNDNITTTITIAYAPMNEDIEKVMEKFSNCLEAHTKNASLVLEGYESESELLDEYIKSRSFKSAIVFPDGLENPQRISYKIRVTGILDTNHLYPDMTFDLDPSSTDLQSRVNRYVDSGFIGMQICLDKSLIDYISEETVSNQYHYALRGFGYPSKESSDTVVPAPYWPWWPFIFVILYTAMSPSIIRKVVGEKQTGIKELLKLNGVPAWLQLLSWMLYPILEAGIIYIIGIAILYYAEIDVVLGPSLVFSNPGVWWLLFILHTMYLTAYSLLISAFFTSPTLATAIGTLIYLLCGLSAAMLLFLYPHLCSGLWKKLGLSLLPFLSLYFTLSTSLFWEWTRIGLQWRVIWEKTTPSDPTTLGHLILMTCVSIILYLLLAIYMENVLPSEYGVRKPAYYIFQPIINLIKKPKANSEIKDSLLDLQEKESNMGFEAPPPNGVVGIAVKNLRKQFGRNIVAVRGVSTNMYSGEIFALLGHNGAGKTTVISMLTGMFSPSSGTAVINGHDIIRNLRKVRESLGLCPQHNMLFENLTVKEHLFFFGMVKGLSCSEAKHQVDHFLQILNFLEKAHSKSKDLSGGQKRKLSVGLALLGGSKVIMLDEPTSGMDPEARREVWDILLSMREGRTILLTTHFMEEADVLGDRIGIMAEGLLQCCGSSLYLKRFYGSGYTLKLTITQEGQREEVLQFVQNFVKDASFKFKPVVASNSNQAELLLITLPSESAPTWKLAEMFTALMDKKEKLCLVTVGLSLATIEDVFMRVGELSGHLEDSSAPKTVETEASQPDKEKGWEPLQGFSLIVMQVMGLFFKKGMYSVRRWKLVMFQFLLPPLITTLTVVSLNTDITPRAPAPPLKMTLNSYEKPVTIFSADPPLEADILESIKGSKKLPKAFDKLEDFLDKIREEDPVTFMTSYIVALSAAVTQSDSFNYNYTALFSSVPSHAAPLAINLVSNLILRQVDPNTTRKITISNHPLQTSVEGILSVMTLLEKPVILSFSFILLMTIALCILSTTFTIIPIEERVTKAKQLQLMTGVNPLSYWMTYLVYDSIISVLIVALITCCFSIFQIYEVFTSHNAAAVAFLILISYLLASLPMAYLVALIAGSTAGGFALLFIANIIMGLVVAPNMLYYEGVPQNSSDLSKGPLSESIYFRHICRLFPVYGVVLSLAKFSETCLRNSYCKLLTGRNLQLVCESESEVMKPFQICCRTFKPSTFLTWDRVLLSSNGNGQDLIGPGVGQELFYVIIMGLAYLGVLLLVELGAFRKIKEILGKSKLSAFELEDIDEDVLDENERVAQMVSRGTTGEDALVVENLCKSYGMFAAVSRLSFGVHHGECFGLLGSNGAGKSSTFRMLTGDEVRSFGNAHSSNFSLEKNSAKFLAGVGYCPQFDAIIETFSGREMLKLFCMLRGVPWDKIGMEVDKWLENVGLVDSANVQCQKYSGGMKRRLSAALAMVGSPKLLLLDEPTSGVDPVSRRQFWKVLESVKNGGQSIILTSHSMDECEALCDRLGIMVNGQLRCLGGIQHLKHKFAQGYSVTLKLYRDISEESAELRKLDSDICQKFHPCTLKDKHQNILQYHIENTRIPWNIMFQSLEDLKAQNESMVEDYSINESTLEEVFLSFARKQFEERKVKASICKRVMTCQF